MFLPIVRLCSYPPFTYAQLTTKSMYWQLAISCSEPTVSRSIFGAWTVVILIKRKTSENLSRKSQQNKHKTVTAITGCSVTVSIVQRINIHMRQEKLQILALARPKSVTAVLWIGPQLSQSFLFAYFVQLSVVHGLSTRVAQQKSPDSIGGGSTQTV